MTIQLHRVLASSLALALCATVGVVAVSCAHLYLESTKDRGDMIAFLISRTAR